MHVWLSHDRCYLPVLSERAAVQATLPCSEAQTEAKPVVLPFSILMDASIDVSFTTHPEYHAPACGLHVTPAAHQGKHTMCSDAQDMQRGTKQHWQQSIVALHCSA